MGRHQGRITKEDIREAGFRRWDGRKRVTTDWLNVFHDPELCWTDGDLLIYLREPGQSSRGPAFRVHTSRLQAKGFESLLSRCTERRILHTSPDCSPSKDCECHGNLPLKELYLPAPPQSGIDETFDHHITSRNFFAWLYNMPLAGRALGPSLVVLLERLDLYRPYDHERNRAEVIALAESQKYLDFRECVDHALAILHFAEYLQQDSLWIDAFAHCVGLSHRRLRESVEFEHISAKTAIEMNESRLAMDLKLGQVTDSIGNFFEGELSSTFLGLHQAARDHLDRFRSFLHSYYIEQHGFWPPDNSDGEVTQRLVCNSMYSDFRSLYHHLADTKATESGSESEVSISGGICVLQNVRSFDSRSGFDPLPDLLPQVPCEANTNVDTIMPRRERRNSWNPLVKRKFDKEARNAKRMQALVDSTNRDWTLMSCVLVRRFSEFEVKAATDELETISLADGRKVRWIAVYAILQILISVMQAPKEVRNKEGLSYSLCCKAPELLPWQDVSPPESVLGVKPELRPDMTHSHTNTEPARPALARKSSGLKERPETNDTAPRRRSITRTASALRSSSLRRLMGNKSDVSLNETSKKKQSFCEIYVPGYGNGLNPVEIEYTASPTDENVPTFPNSNSVSRESSNASSNSTWSKTSSDSGSTAKTPDTSSADITKAMAELGLAVAQPECKLSRATGAIQIIPAEEGLETVHFNAKTWTDMLRS